MSMYGQSIALALPGVDPADYPEIENIMRDHILHSNLDWVPTDLFRDTAQLAYEALLFMRAEPTGVAESQSEPNGRK
jgi:hypothetical protein